MQPLLANLYDRISANRLICWVKISDAQTAFQKGKGTLDQIFILRIIISLIKYNKLTHYIGFFDLSKAFDRVSRFLLGSFNKNGCGNCYVECSEMYVLEHALYTENLWENFKCF